MVQHLRKRLKHSHPAIKGFFVFILFIILAILIPIKKTPLDIAGVLSATAIFYSILLGFYIAAAMANLSRLKTLVAVETGGLISVYHLVKESMPQKLEETKKLIDNYLIKRFDYEIHDYTEPTTKEFFAIFDILKDAEAKSHGGEAAIEYIAEGLYYLPPARREITIVGAKIMNKLTWALLVILSLVIIASLFFMRDGTIESSAVTVFLSTAAILALFILADVDGNRFGEEQFAVDTYQDVFRAMGELPYYSKLYLEAGRYKPPEKHYRTGEFGSIKVIGGNKV